MTSPPGGRDIAAGDVLLAVEDVSLAFGGVKAVSGVSFDIRKGEIRAIIGPNGAGKTSMLNVINGFYHPQRGRITFKGKARAQMRPYEAALGGIARTFQNVALFKGMTALDNIMAGRTLKMRRGFFWQLIRHRAGARRKRRSTATASRRSSTSSRSSTSARSRSASCPTDCRSGSSSAARSPWSPICCCSTSRWPG